MKISFLLTTKYFYYINMWIWNETVLSFCLFLIRSLRLRCPKAVVPLELSFSSWRIMQLTFSSLCSFTIEINWSVIPSWILNTYFRSPLRSLLYFYSYVVVLPEYLFFFPFSHLWFMRLKKPQSLLISVRSANDTTVWRRKLVSIHFNCD